MFRLFVVNQCGVKILWPFNRQSWRSFMVFKFGGWKPIYFAASYSKLERLYFHLFVMFSRNTLFWAFFRNMNCFLLSHTREVFFNYVISKYIRHPVVCVFSHFYQRKSLFLQHQLLVSKSGDAITDSCFQHPRLLIWSNYISAVSISWYNTWPPAIIWEVCCIKWLHFHMAIMDTEIFSDILVQLDWSSL